MRKILLSLGLLSAMILCTGALAADDNDNKPKKGKGKLRDTWGKRKIDNDKLFGKLDADKDGKLTREEFRKVFEHLAPNPILEKLGDRRDALADRMFDRLDKDKDGKLTKEEFKEFNGVGGNRDLGDLKDKLEKLKELKDKFGKKGDKKEDKKDQ
jgi:hypothetical protein